MANRKRAYRWFLFFVAVCCLVYSLFVHVTPSVVAVFFASGGLWYWLEQRKTRELDAPRPR